MGKQEGGVRWVGNTYQGREQQKNGHGEPLQQRAFVGEKGFRLNLHRDVSLAARFAAVSSGVKEGVRGRETPRFASQRRVGRASVTQGVCPPLT